MKKKWKIKCEEEMDIIRSREFREKWIVKKQEEMDN